MNWSARVDGDLEHQMRGWRRHLHAHPEIGFEEHETSRVDDFQVGKLSLERADVGRGQVPTV